MSGIHSYLFRLTFGTVLLACGVGALLFVASGGQPPKPLDMWALRECAPDFGGEWKPWPEHKYRYSGAARGSNSKPTDLIFQWMASVTDPSQPPSPRNRILDSASVRIRICANSIETQRWASGFSIAQVPPIAGSYSGKAIGDWSVRSARIDRSAWLVFTRGNIVFSVNCGGTSPLDWPTLAEGLALALVERADAAMALAASPDATVQVGTSSLGCRQPNGVALVHVSEYATASGGSCQVDMAGGTALITRNGHTLKVNIGRKEAWLDGKAVTLPFPALRHGVNQVYCPLDTLRKLGN